VAECKSFDYRDYLDPEREGPPDFLSKEEILELSNSQKESLARLRGIDLSRITKNKARRAQAIAELLLEHQARTERSLIAEADQVLVADKTIYTLAALQGAKSLGPNIISQPEELMPPEENRASPETIGKLAQGLRDVVRMSKRGKKVFQKIRRAQTRQMKATLEKVVQKGVTEQDRKRIGAILQSQSDAYRSDIMQKLITPENLNELTEHLAASPVAKRAGPLRTAGMEVALANLVTDGILPFESDAQALASVFGPQIQEVMREAMTNVDVALEWAQKLWNMPRVLIASTDLSATGRQGLAGLLAHPIKGARDFYRQIQAFGSEKKAREFEDTWLNDPDIRELRGLGLFMSPFDQIVGASSEREEIWMHNIVDHFTNHPRFGKIPKIMFAVPKMSERAFVTFLNSQRFWMAKGLARQAKEEGFTVDEHPEAFKDIANFVNSATGRGNLPIFSNTWLNGLFFSPRFVTSRFEHIFWRLPKALGNRQAPLALRKEALRQTVAMSFFWASIFTMAGVAAKAFGWEDEEEGISFGINPLHPQFLKFKVGDVRTDFGGGYAQIMRSVVGAATGFTALQEDRLYIDTDTGKLERVKSGVDPRGFWASIMRELVRFKLAPSASLLVSVGEGRFPGSRDPVTPSKIVEQLFVPISLQEIDDLFREHGLKGTIGLFPEVVGFSTTIHLDDPGTSLWGLGTFADMATGEAMFNDPFYFDSKKEDSLLTRLATGRAGR
jgi:hypothetical protein